MAPVAAWAREEDKHLVLDAAVLSFDGKKRLSVTRTGNVEDGVTIGCEAASELAAHGARDLIESARSR